MSLLRWQAQQHLARTAAFPDGESECSSPGATSPSITAAASTSVATRITANEPSAARRETKAAKRSSKGFEGKQRSYVESPPNHLLSGSLECGACGGAIGLVSGKGSGYYGCLNASRRACENKVLIARKRLEDKFVAALNEKVLNPELLDQVYERTATKVKELFADVPEELRLKKVELNRAETRVHNFIEFIASGRATPTLSDALSQAEEQVKSLSVYIQSMEAAKDHAFTPPPRAWIDRCVPRATVVPGAGLVGVRSGACTRPHQRARKHLVDTPKPDQLVTDSRQISGSQSARDQPNCHTHWHWEQTKMPEWWSPRANTSECSGAKSPRLKGEEAAVFRHGKAQLLLIGRAT